MIQNSIVRRKLTNKNLNSDSIVVYPNDVASYIAGTLKTLIVHDENEQELERYYGYGLEKLMETVKKFKDKPWALATRIYKNNTINTPKKIDKSHGFVCSCDECQ